MDKILAHKTGVRNEIDQVLSQARGVDLTTITWERDFLDRLKPFAMAGKLLRGSLLCYSFEACTGRAVSPGVLQVAAALEIVHSALLIHDDVMDQDKLRRGRPAMHIQYQDLTPPSSLSEASQFGANMAIGGGDLALLLSLGLLAQADIAADPKIKVQELFSRTLIAVCAGQMQDIYLGASPSMPSKKALVELIKTKTALYTISLPLVTGAILAEQSGQTLRTLQTIGEATGTIFQLRDDELGISGNSAEMGKPVGSDFASGKKTIAAYYLLEHSRGADKRRLQELFGSGQQDAESTDFVRQCLETYNISGLLARHINKLEQKATRAVETLLLPPSDKQELKSLISFCAQRKA